MSEKKTFVNFEETPRIYRTEIPNIVFDLLEAEVISQSDFILYTTLRRIAGENGKSWVGARNLSKKCKLSTKTITKCKKSLTASRPELNGKSLINLESRSKQDQESDLITIVDIWEDNFNAFKNIPTWSKRKPPLGEKETTPGVKGNQKNEPFKKKPFKKERSEDVEIVHNSDDEQEHFDSSFLSSNEKEKKEADQEDLLIDLFLLEKYYMEFMNPNTVARWINKFGAESVLNHIKLFLDTHDKVKIPIKNPEAWMETALKKDFIKEMDRRQVNKNLALKLKKEGKLRTLKINKMYCCDTVSGKDAYYHLPNEMFAQIMKIMCEMDRNYMGELKEHVE